MIENLLFVEAPLPGFFGSGALYACLPHCPCPVGFFWYRMPGIRTVEILYMFVNEELRKKGIARALLSETRRRYPGFDVLTAVASVLAEPMLVKVGFEKNENGWLLKGVK